MPMFCQRQRPHSPSQSVALPLSGQRSVADGETGPWNCPGAAHARALRKSTGYRAMGKGTLRNTSCANFRACNFPPAVCVSASLFSKEDIQSGIASEIAAATSEGCISKTRSLIYQLAYLDTNSGSCSVTVDQCWRCYSMYFQGVNYPALMICTPRYDENTTVLKAVMKSANEPERGFRPSVPIPWSQNIPASIALGSNGSNYCNCFESNVASLEASQRRHLQERKGKANRFSAVVKVIFNHQ
ncbi:hypothetical protein DPX16_18864 [Anabarilius grahami]|uniref:Uncharacterized protein n=1 Tax=Anabarilius grahami TaxID=495550 RepID=A0A3N0YLJ7_ANAGA|nr:hypothetical protein DPX16_18864 [Anabarilius grahami]